MVSAARSGHFGRGLFMKSWNDIISLGYHYGWIWGYDGYDFPAWTVLFASFRKRDPAPWSAPSQERHPQLWIYSLRIASLKGSTASEAMAGSSISGQLDVEESQGFKS